MMTDYMLLIVHERKKKMVNNLNSNKFCSTFPFFVLHVAISDSVKSMVANRGTIYTDYLDLLPPE